jgi:hypothetical protein
VFSIAGCLSSFASAGELDSRILLCDLAVLHYHAIFYEVMDPECFGGPQVHLVLQIVLWLS